MTTFTGTHHNDNLTGTSGRDVFDLKQGGDDEADGLGGRDEFRLRDALTADDRLDGGTEKDTLLLDGDYSAGVVFAAATIKNIEAIKLADGNSYSLTTHNGNIAAGTTLKVYAPISVGFTLFFDGSAEKDGRFNIAGGEDNDVITGGRQNDVFKMGDAGDDTVNGGDGKDIFDFQASLTGNDRIDGGGGTDTVLIDSHGSGPLSMLMQEATLKAVETLKFAASGDTYQLLTADGNVAAGKTLTVDASALTAVEAFTFDGSNEADGHFHFIVESLFESAITGGVQADTFDVNAAASKTNFTGYDGNDVFKLHETYSGDYYVAGGAGLDTVTFDGDYSGGLKIEQITHPVFGVLVGFNDIQEFDFAAGGSYDVDVNGNVANDAILTFDASALGASDSFYLDLADGADFRYVVKGGAGDDLVYFGTEGNSGDTITLGGGADTLQYDDASASSSTTYDTVTDLNADEDVFILGVTVTAVKTGLSGAINTASFDTNMGVIIDDWLATNQAAVVTASGGTLIGHVFLVVDGDASLNYTGGNDYVFDITGFIGTVDPTTFT